MKKAGKGILLCLLMVLVYLIVNGVAFGILPFSTWFKEGSASQPTNMLLTVIYISWIVGTMYFMTASAQGKGKMLYLTVIGSVFFIQTFMTQIETMIFGSAFKGLGTTDILLMMAGEGSAIAVTGFLMVWLGKRKSQTAETVSIDRKKFLKMLLLNALIYMVIYFVFGYFVAWKSEDLRIFYSGQAADYGFLQKLYTNFRDNAVIYPVQYLRGMLFTVGIVPLMKIKWKHRVCFLISVCAVFLCTAMGLIVPNFLFPDAVRIRHFMEMVSSMLLFGVITTVLMGRCRKISTD